ncbi:MAG TPA: CBS domain-containing protein [Noviherbaspirillum sp.]|nr:CBS domain-containing protein [Noviherbaspirillum sp.]
MKRISEVMTPDVTVVRPDDKLQQAARIMRDEDIGALPVCDGKRLVGMITDRDIAIRAVAEGKAADQCLVSEVMTNQVLWCYEDQNVGEVLQQMAHQQIRRIPVINRNMELVGIVAIGDLATRQSQPVDAAMEDISAPFQPPPRTTGKQPSRH